MTYIQFRQLVALAVQLCYAGKELYAFQGGNAVVSHIDTQDVFDFFLTQNAVLIIIDIAASDEIAKNRVREIGLVDCHTALGSGGNRDESCQHRQAEQKTNGPFHHVHFLLLAAADRIRLYKDPQPQLFVQISQENLA